MNVIPSEKAAIERLWTYEDLQTRWGIGARQVRDAVTRLGIKPVPISQKTKRFRPAAVMAAEERAENGGKRPSGALWKAPEN